MVLLPGAVPCLWRYSAATTRDTRRGLGQQGQAAELFSGKWQATLCPDTSSASGGSCVLQISWAFQHLVWNRHAGGGFSGLGTSPVSRMRSLRARVPPSPRTGSGTGTADISATVYG